MWLSDISIKRPVLAIVMSAILVIFGLVGLQRLSVREYPDIDSPVVSVTTLYEGASPDVIETTITEPLEDEITSIEGIKTLTSSSQEGVSDIIVEFELSRDIAEATQDVRDRVARARRRLPANVEEPVIIKQDADAQPIIWLGLAGDNYSQLQLTDYADRYVIDQLQTIPGVGRVRIGGEREYAMRLWLDPAKMAARQITAVDVRDALQRENLELPSGRIEGQFREFSIRTMGEMSSPEQFNRLIIKMVNGRPVYLQDVGHAEVGSRSDRSMVRMNGKPAVGLGIIKQSKANTLEIAHRVKERLADLQQGLPPGMILQIGYDSSRFIEQSIDEVKESLFLSIALVVLVIFVFLGNFRATLIPAVAIPVSLVATFFVMYVLNYSINTLTLLALTLAIGLVVDDAIVVLENISRLIEEGKKPMDAAFQGMKEIAFAVVATTLVLVAIFVPIAFMQGTVGRLFSEFAIALAGSVIISMFVALTLSPMMGGRILRNEAPTHWAAKMTDRFRLWVDQIRDGYVVWLGRAMQLKLHVILVALAFMLVAGLSYFFMQKEFLPQEDRGFLLTFISSPEGSSLAYTDKAMRQAEAVYKALPEVKRYFSVLAFSQSGLGNVNEGIMFVTLNEERNRSQAAILGEIMPKMMAIEEASVFPISPPSGPTGISNQPLQLVIEGFDLQELNDAGEKILAEMMTFPALYRQEKDLKLDKPQVRVEINRELASNLGVSVRDISSTLQILMGGLDITTFQLNNKRYDVMVQMPPELRTVPQNLERIFVSGRDDGVMVPLGSVVEYKESVSPKAISHYSRLKAVNLTSNIAPIPGVSLGTMMPKIEAIAKAILPTGMKYEWAGESRELLSAQNTTTLAFLLAMVVVYLVLSAQFESFVDPLIIMITVPLAVSGAFITLFAAGASFNVYSQIGMILLIGLVTKNGILIVEYANTLQQQQPDWTLVKATVEACAIRFRPILMTAVSTIFGALPLGLGLGAGAQSRQALGLTVIGGMVIATVLTLFVIPVVYMLIKRQQTTIANS